MIGLYIAYVIPTFLRLRRGHRFERGPWHLGGASPLIGIDIKDPVAYGKVDRTVPRRREIVMPLVIYDAGTVSRGNLTAAIAGTGVGNNNLVDESRDRPQTSADMAFLVSHDKSRRDQFHDHPAPSSAREKVHARRKLRQRPQMTPSAIPFASG